MEGVHDLGGLGGFGPVRTPGSDATHTEEWEVRAQWLALAACRSSRPWIERIDPPNYLATSYYGRWLRAAEMGAVGNGIVTAAELAASLETVRARIEQGELPVRANDPARARAVADYMTSTSPSAPAVSPRFAVGDAVVPKRMWQPDVHHRCPRYVRGVRGVIERICGVEPLAGVRRAEVIEPVYTVRFESPAVWGDRSDEVPFAIHVDMWDSYLDAA